MPYTPCIDNYMKSGLPQKYQSVEIKELQKLMGSDLIRYPSCVKVSFDDTVKHTHTESADGIISDVYETPLGTLKEEHKLIPESPHIPFPTEYLIKKASDLKILNYLLQHKILEPDYEDLEATIKKFDDVMIAPAIDDTPYVQLYTKYIGVENFVYMYFEDPPAIEETMQIWQEVNNKAVEIAASSPAEVFICYENTNTGHSSTEWIEQYELPALNDYANIMHAKGKKLLIHMCGKLNMVIDKIAESEFDGIIDVSPAPTGDCNFTEAAGKMAKHSKIIAGGIECNAYASDDNQKFTKDVNLFARQLSPYKNFWLGSGDAVPLGATVENLASAREIAGNIKFS